MHPQARGAFALPNRGPRDGTRDGLPITDSRGATICGILKSLMRPRTTRLELLFKQYVAAAAHVHVRPNTSQSRPRAGQTLHLDVFHCSPCQHQQQSLERTSLIPLSMSACRLPKLRPMVLRQFGRSLSCYSACGLTSSQHLHVHNQLPWLFN